MHDSGVAGRSYWARFPGHLWSTASNHSQFGCECRFHDSHRERQHGRQPCYGDIRRNIGRVLVSVAAFFWCHVASHLDHIHGGGAVAQQGEGAFSCSLRQLWCVSADNLCIAVSPG